MSAGQDGCRLREPIGRPCCSTGRIDAARGEVAGVVTERLADRAYWRRPLKESDLVERARRGDEDAYEAIVRLHQEVAFRTAYAITRSAAEAEDTAQDAFVKAYFALPRFREGASFRPWLLRIVANEARNRRVAAGRRAGLTLRAAESGTPPAAPDSPEASALAAERRATLLAAVNALRPDDRLVLAYRYFFDMGEAEMATALGCARGTVKSRLARALGRLRGRLLDDDGGEALRD